MVSEAITDKIKRVRKNKKITLKKLSETTGLTEGYLSRIENSKTIPPISTLSRIAIALDIDVPFLLLEKWNIDGNNPNFVIVRKENNTSNSRENNSPSENKDKTFFEPIAENKKGKNMEPFILVPDFELNDAPKHDGEEFIYVLDGQIEFFYGTEMHLLSKGDSVYLDAKIPHNLRSLGEKKAKVLVIFYHYKRF